ncbi:MAG: glycosyltransferase [Bifidobacteriaceae bacterium]|jgi:glycosyltransferase involved in cell wall biosynthesis|nr:glycosyltransferase [Bifidobacteriaceae bacterium]
MPLRPARAAGREPEDLAKHVVMAVANPIRLDARVRKTARAVRDLGYRVSVVWAAEPGGEPVAAEMDGIATIGLPVSYRLRDWAAARDLAAAQRAARAWRPAYRAAEDRRLAAARLAARQARLGGGAPGAGLRAAQAVHRLRSKAHSVQSGRRRRRATRARQARGWRAELMNVADLEGVFTPWLERLQPDILHLHDIHLLGAGVNAKRARLAAGAPVKLVYDAHEYVRGMHGPNRYQIDAYAAMERELVAQADGVVTVSQAIAEALERELGLGARPTVVLNTPPLAAAAQAGGGGPSLRARLGLAGAVPLAVYAGVLHTNRNLRQLVDAIGQLEGWHLALVCVPHPRTPAAARLAERIGELGLQDRVHLVEPVAPEQVAGFLSSATLGVHPMSTGLPNHEMALPNKLFDYIWAGLPVAVSRAQTMAQLVADSGLGAAFDPADPADIARALRQVAARRDQFAQAAGAAELRQRYAWEVQAARLAALYAALDPAGAGP